jgi:hypothetical protein
MFTLIASKDFFDEFEKRLDKFIDEHKVNKQIKWRMKGWVEKTKRCCRVLMTSDEPEEHAAVHNEMMVLMSRMEWICYTAISCGYEAHYFKDAWQQLVSFYDSFGWWINDTD